MKQLIYVSRPTSEVDPQMVKEILNTSYKNNFDNDISGMLVSDGEYFIQCIEGDEEAIDKLYSDISKDNRHCDIKMLGTIDIDQKDFEEWEMAYVSSKKDIIDAIKELTSGKDLTPYQLTFLEAKSILKKLTSLL